MCVRSIFMWCLACGFLAIPWNVAMSVRAGEVPVALEAGLAMQDVTPDRPLWLAGYAGRKKPSEGIDTPLLAQACALRSGASTVVIVSLDNCEVSREFTAPVLTKLQQIHGLPPGAVIIVSSHTHSGPVVEGPLYPMYPLDAKSRDLLQRYGQKLQAALIEVVTAALRDLRPAWLEQGTGRATFAMNRREFQENGVKLGENPEGPVDWDVPVLKVKGTNNTLRAVLFGYACHANTIRDSYAVSGDYMAYARQHLEAAYPGAMAMFLPGMGGDANPHPLGRLLDAKRHGLELARAVVGVLDRPMQRVSGPLNWAYKEVELPLATPPSQRLLAYDAQSKNVHVAHRAQGYLTKRRRGQPLPTAVRLPMATVRIGNDLTFLFMAGEVVVDYALRFKHQYATDGLWTVGYAFEVPCYIPSKRLLKEGGYEAASSMVYYGVYGPFKPEIETVVAAAADELLARVRSGTSNP